MRENQLKDKKSMMEVENTRLKSQLVEENVSEFSGEMSTLKEEVEELC